jgi:hypothetical protein
LAEQELLDLKRGAAGEKKREGGGGDGARVPNSFLVYEVLADEDRRLVYDRHFMPSLVSGSVDSAAFLSRGVFLGSVVEFMARRCQTVAGVIVRPWHYP